MAVEHVKLRVGDGPADGDGSVVISVSTLQAADQIVVSVGRTDSKAMRIVSTTGSPVPDPGLAAAQDFEPIVASQPASSSSLHVAGVACITVAPEFANCSDNLAHPQPLPADQRRCAPHSAAETLPAPQYQTTR